MDTFSPLALGLGCVRSGVFIGRRGGTRASARSVQTLPSLIFPFNEFFFIPFNGLLDGQACKKKEQYRIYLKAADG